MAQKQQRTSHPNVTFIMGGGKERERNLFVISGRGCHLEPPEHRIFFLVEEVFLFWFF